MSLTMKELWGSSHISAGHAAYLESLYEIFINNPEDLSKEWFDFFTNLPSHPKSNGEISHLEIIKDFYLLLNALTNIYSLKNSENQRYIKMDNDIGFKYEGTLRDYYLTAEGEYVNCNVMSVIKGEFKFESCKNIIRKLQMKKDNMNFT